MARRLRIAAPPRQPTILQTCLRSQHLEVREMAAQMLGEAAGEILDAMSREPDADHAAIFHCRVIAGEEASVDSFFAGNEFAASGLTVLALTALYERLALQLPLRTTQEARFIALRCACLDEVPAARGPARSVVDGVEDEVRDEVDEQRDLLGAIQQLRVAVLRDARLAPDVRARAAVGLEDFPASASTVLRVDEAEPDLLLPPTIWRALVASGDSRRDHRARRALALRCVAWIARTTAGSGNVDDGYARLRWPDTLRLLSLRDRSLVCSALIDAGCVLSEPLLATAMQDSEGQAAILARLRALPVAQQARVLGAVDVDEAREFVEASWANDAALRAALVEQLPTSAALWQDPRLVRVFLHTVETAPAHTWVALLRGGPVAESEVIHILSTAGGNDAVVAAGVITAAADVKESSTAVGEAAAAFADRMVSAAVEDGPSALGSAEAPGETGRAQRTRVAAALSLVGSVGDRRSLERLLQFENRARPSEAALAHTAIMHIRRRTEI